MAKHTRKRLKDGFTLVETLVALFVMCAVCAIVLPIYLNAKSHAREATCFANLRQTGLALSLYVADYDNTYPTAVSAVFKEHHADSDKTWRDLLVPYLKPTRFLQCPVASSPANMPADVRPIDLCGYAYNQRLSLQAQTNISTEYVGRSESYVAHPSITVSLFDARPGILVLREPDTARGSELLHGIWRKDLTWEIMSLAPGAFRHHGGANYVMVDGHVKWLKPDQISSQSPSDGIRPGFGL